MIETRITGRKYRVYDAKNKSWKRLSFWTKAADVEYNDGQTAEQKATTLSSVVNRINALTTSVTEIKKVTVLPSDAANHPTTLYLLVDEKGREAL